MACHAHDGVVKADHLAFGEAHDIVPRINSTIQDQPPYAVGEGVRVESTEEGAVGSAKIIDADITESSTQHVEIASDIAGTDLLQPLPVAVPARISECPGQLDQMTDLGLGVRRWVCCQPGWLSACD